MGLFGAYPTYKRTKTSKMSPKSLTKTKAPISMLVVPTLTQKNMRGNRILRLTAADGGNADAPLREHLRSQSSQLIYSLLSSLSGCWSFYDPTSKLKEISLLLPAPVFNPARSLALACYMVAKYFFFLDSLPHVLRYEVTKHSSHEKTEESVMS